MTTGQRIEIPLSKSKIVLMFIGALTFVAIGLWFLIAPPQIENSYWGNPTRIAIAGYASIIFFGLCAVVLMRKLHDNKPGLIIDDTGLTDNSSGLSAGHILWTDIENISVLEIHKQRLLMLEVSNPKDYIDKQNSLFKRKGMALNYKMYGTLLSLTANGLKVPFTELLALVTERFRETRTNAHQRFAAIQADE
jgi:hypothetical protein